MLKRLVIAAVALLAVGGTASAEDDTSLAQARRDVDSSDYMAARNDLVSALNAGTADPDQLAEIYKLSGIVEAALGNTTGSATAFAKWLELDPKAALPAGTSPKITRPFEAAQKNKIAKLELKPETSSDPPRLSVLVVADAERLVARARAYVVVDGKPEQQVEASSKGKGKIEIELPKGKRLDVRVEVLDAHGNRLALVGSKDVPIVITSNGEPEQSGSGSGAGSGSGSGSDTTITGGPKPEDRGPEEPTEGRPLYLKWWLWGGVAVAFAGGATYFGLQARSDADTLKKLNADSQNHNFSEAQTVQDRANREALMFNIGIASAGALAIFAGVLYFTEPKARAEAHVGAVPTQGGAAVVLGGTF